MESRVPQLLLNAKIITDDQYKTLLTRQKDSGNSVITDLVKMGLVTEPQITKFLASYYNLSVVDLDNVEIPPDVMKLLSPEFVQKYSVVPLSRSGRNLQVALVDPSIQFIIDDIKFISGFEVEPTLATQNAFLKMIERSYKLHGTLDQILKDMGDGSVELIQDQQEENDLAAIRNAIDVAPIVKLVDGLIYKIQMKYL